MNIIKSTYNFAEYNCGAYGTGTYQNAICDGTNPSSGGGLADTGYDVLIPIFIGISLVVASLILLAKRWLRARKRRRAEAQAV